MGDLKMKILRHFIENTDYMELMRNCTHYDSKYKINPYHMECDVWTHTMMVYNQANKDDYIELIIALCHDIGKITTRKVNEKNGRISFFGHADHSVQPTIDFLDSLYNAGIITKNMVYAFINVGLPVISNHTIMYQNFNKFDHFCYTEYKSSLGHYMSRMSEIDGGGSFTKSEKIDNSKNIEKVPFKPTEYDPNKPTMTIWTGVPGSGKDYLANKAGQTIVSFDDIRIEKFRNVRDTHHLSKKEEYKKAFTYCNKHKIDLMACLNKKVKEIDGDVSICNTSLKRKARKSLINTFYKKFNIVINQVFAPSNVIFKRNNDRKSKTIPNNVIDRMMKDYHVATHFEKNVTKINYIYNA